MVYEGSLIFFPRKARLHHQSCMKFYYDDAFSNLSLRVKILNTVFSVIVLHLNSYSSTFMNIQFSLLKTLIDVLENSFCMFGFGGNDNLVSSERRNTDRAVHWGSIHHEQCNVRSIGFSTCYQCQPSIFVPDPPYLQSYCPRFVGQTDQTVLGNYVVVK